MTKKRETRLDVDVCCCALKGIMERRDSTLEPNILLEF